MIDTRIECRNIIQIIRSCLRMNDEGCELLTHFLDLLSGVFERMGESA